MHQLLALHHERTDRHGTLLQALTWTKQLNQHGLDIRPLGSQIGLASAIKMCYAGLTKGLTALCAVADQK